MIENSLCRSVGIYITSESKDIFNTVSLKFPAKFFDFFFVIAQTGKMSYCFGMILLADLPAYLDCLVVIGASSSAECNTDIIRLKITKYLKGLINIGKFLLSLGREYLKRKYPLSGLIDFS